MAKRKQKSASVAQAATSGTVDSSDPSSPYQKARKRIFQCQFCAKEFHRNEHLQRHERLHTKEKPFRCSTCSQTFTRRDLLARHVRMLHEPSVEQRGPETLAAGQEEPQHIARILGSSICVPEPAAEDGSASWHESSHLNSNLTSSGPGLPLSTDPNAQANPARSDNRGVSPEMTRDVPQISWAQPTSNFGDFDLFIDSMNMPCGNNAAFLIDQPTLPLSPHPLFGDLNEVRPDSQQSPSYWTPHYTTKDSSTPRLFDEFSSTFPSFESPFKSKHEPWRVSQPDWECLLNQLRSMAFALPPNFLLPSRHTMTRYIATYFSGFHRHLPFLHLPTFEPTRQPVELILAMASIGAQSAFDNANAVMFFRASYSITSERLRRRKDEVCDMKFSAGPQNVFCQDATTLPGQIPEDVSADESEFARFDPLPIAQTLLVLMAMATWGNSRAIYDEAIGLQNILVKLMREERLLDPRAQPSETMGWDDWVRVEGFNRTVGIIFSFLIFHTIVYDTPPPILNSELAIHLPSLETSWAARSEKEWQESRRQRRSETSFQSCFSGLFSKGGNENNSIHHGSSSLGGFILILALIQHIYLLRNMARSRPPFNQGLSSEDVVDMEQALRNWQHRWYKDPESSFGPGSPHGPISFNSTALLRMAYIRLTVDVGPWRALNTHDPSEIAESIHRSPDLEPTPKLTRAVLYSAHALSIPVKIGVNIVARNQAFAWSLQHSLCALECAFVLSKWLIAIQLRSPSVSLSEDETRLLAYIADMVAEADSGFSIDSHSDVIANLPELCIRVVQIWAKLLSGVAVWDVVRMIGKALTAYGQMLEQQWGKVGIERNLLNDTE